MSRRAPTVWLTVTDVMTRLQVSSSSAVRIMRQLPRFKDGRITRVSEEALDNYVFARTQPPNVDMTLESRLRAADTLIRSYEAELRRRPPRTPNQLPARSDAPMRIPLTRARETLDDAPSTVHPKIRHTRQPRILPEAPTGRIKPTRPREILED